MTEISGGVFANGLQRTVVYYAGNPATAAANELVAAVATTKFRVLSVHLHATGGANTATFKSATTAISGAWDILSDTSLLLPYNPEGWFETVAGEALNLTLSAATAVAVTMTYVAIT